MRKHESVRRLEYAAVELGGIAYAIVPVGTLIGVCLRAGVEAKARVGGAVEAVLPEEINGANVGRRIADRRKRAGLTQGELARRAGVRIETVNRIERGRVMPDFRTIRKLVEAMPEEGVGKVQRVNVVK